MKYCSSCGSEIKDEAVICTKCGCAVNGKTLQGSKSKNMSTMQTIALVFMIISCVGYGMFLIPLAWTIPMTISYSNKIKNGEEITIGFKICCLLFVSLIAGILMLCDSSSEN